jgi:hypothetical protein
VIHHGLEPRPLALGSGFGVRELGDDLPLHRARELLQLDPLVFGSVLATGACRPGLVEARPNSAMGRVMLFRWTLLCQSRIHRDLPLFVHAPEEGRLLIVTEAASRQPRSESWIRRPGAKRGAAGSLR